MNRGIQRKTSIEKELCWIRAKRRFRAAIRTVIENRFWLSDVESQEIGDNVQQNVAIITQRKHKSALLTLKEKLILFKRKEWRTEEEQKHLYRTIGGLKCFRRYPEEVQRQLAGVTGFAYFGPNRVIVKQGARSEALFFVVSGEVKITQSAFDPVSNETIIEKSLTVGSGSMFGEVSLLHDVPRTATVTTLTPCELLLLRRDDFETILKETLQEQWAYMIKAMSRFKYFQNWSKMTTTECCLLMKLINYVPQETILGDAVGFTDYTYFILEGTAQILEHMCIKSKTINKKIYYELCETMPSKRSLQMLNKYDKSHFLEHLDPNLVVDFESRASRPRRLLLTSAVPPKPYKSCFMNVCELSSLACFNIGEYSKNRSVVAITPITCMAIPTYWLMLRNTGNVWTQVKTYLDSHLPSTKQLFQKFKQERKWSDYKKKLVNEILGDKAQKLISGNKYYNVPYSIRIHQRE